MSEIGRQHGHFDTGAATGVGAWAPPGQAPASLTWSKAFVGINLLAAFVAALGIMYLPWREVADAGAPVATTGGLQDWPWGYIAVVLAAAMAVSSRMAQEHIVVPTALAFVTSISLLLLCAQRMLVFGSEAKIGLILALIGSIIALIVSVAAPVAAGASAREGRGRR